MSRLSTCSWLSCPGCTGTTWIGFSFAPHVSWFYTPPVPFPPHDQPRRNSPPAALSQLGIASPGAPPSSWRPCRSRDVMWTRVRRAACLGPWEILHAAKPRMVSVQPTTFSREGRKVGIPAWRQQGGFGWNITTHKSSTPSAPVTGFLQPLRACALRASGFQKSHLDFFSRWVSRGTIWNARRSSRPTARTAPHPKDIEQHAKSKYTL